MQPHTNAKGRLMEPRVWNILRGTYKHFIPDKHQDKVRNLCGKLLAPFYAGSRVNCPCCGRGFRKFLPAGIAGRENARCPGCGSLERNRQAMLYLREKTSLLTEICRVLHIAPEPSLQKLLKRTSSVESISLDLFSPIADIKGDVTNLPFKDQFFDAIICSHVLEHVYEDRKAMNEFFRVLKPSGFAILQIPVDLARDSTYEDSTVTLPADRERLFGQEDHVRVYGRDFTDRLQSSGFDVVVDFFGADFEKSEYDRFGLATDEPIYRCQKPTIHAMQ